ncbi:nuclear transport factor 2 family protein [Trinickia symbiotica]|nr:nuclear transport factor 2 family protein [Trinickia symbiotica]
MTLDEFTALHEISQTKYRYLRAVDTQDWELLRSCFTDDASVWYNQGKFTAEGPDNIIARLKAWFLPVVYSSHIALQPEIELTGPDTAKGTWRLQDIVHFKGPVPDPVRNLTGGEEITGAGYYYDDYRCVNGQWKIARTGYVRLFEQIARRAGRGDVEVKAVDERGVIKAA